MSLKVENKQVVVPGTVLAESMDYLPGLGAYRQGDQILANRMGLVSIDGRAIRLIPLSGTYSPKENDVIIVKVFDVLMSGWRCETNTAYSAMLSVKDASEQFIEKGHDLTSIFGIGDHLVCRITQVTSQKLIDLSCRGPGLMKLPQGQIIKVNPNKVPRIIGKQGSMVSLIKESTGCNIIVGQNGLIWVSGSPKGEVLAIQTIRNIEKFAHVSGLTDTIKGYLAEITKGEDLPAAEPLPEAHPKNFQRRRFDGPRRGGPDRGGRRAPRRFNNNRGEKDE